jgi:methionyl-tRNA synthetase
VSRPTFYITCAIDYVNAKPHLGHAYEKVTADCIARAHRSLGYDVFFLIGNDEHGTKVAKSARAAGKPPREYVDGMELEFREAYRRLNVSYDDFIRTCQTRHHVGVHELLRRVQQNGHITRGKYTGWYCEGCEAFYTEKDLVDGLCPDHATKPRWVEEDNYFFKLSAFRDRLVDHIRSNPDFIRPEPRRNEVLSFLERGLEDLSISRAGGEWGIPFPGDPDHVVYVWFDALTNYLTGIGFGDDEGEFSKWWPADVHIVGKDITRFHCVIWPAMLMAAGLELPKSVFGHGFIYQSGTKMSKSLGNIVNPLDVIDTTGSDPLRYFLIREITYGKDGDFSWESFISRYNADLANDLGNLVKRTVDMTFKFLGGEIAEGNGTGRTGLRNVAEDVASRVGQAYRRLDLSGALVITWELVRRANRAIQETKPWELAKDPARRDELTGTLGELLEALRIVSYLVEPAIPEKAIGIRRRLGLPEDPGGLWDEALAWREATGWKVAPSEPLFPRIDASPDTAAAGRPAKDGSGRAPGEAEPDREEDLIELADFERVKLVVGTILSAEPVRGADRLLELQIDTGDDRRRVVAGIAAHFAPEELKGRQVVLVANLKPARIRDIESRGMILVAQADGRMTLLGPGEEIAAGARIR